MRGRDLMLRAGARRLALADRPRLMGILNATPDSFSGDGARLATLEARVARARELAEEGAEVIDVGGESQITTAPPIAVEEEIERVAPLIERVAAELDVLVSVDTYKPAVAEASVAAGAGMVNDVSGLRDPALADVCVRSGAALVVMHTRAEPKRKALDHVYDDVGADVAAFLRERIALARDRGVTEEQVVVDPGPDFAKTPEQTVEARRADARSAGPRRGRGREPAAGPRRRGGRGLPRRARRAPRRGADRPGPGARRGPAARIPTLRSACGPRVRTA